ncbi:MAG: diguanylate cyclase [Gammaproteobacteria bacterium]|nr:MAG: diguanylate cyclase [Gammaproteobacteria bacterium]
MHDVIHYDGVKRRVLVTQKALPYPAGELVISRVDLNGLITFANESFVYLSGYSLAELIGKPHYVVRHPDMPKMVFKSMWATIQAGKKWRGYIKNLCKDGTHYWVYATVIPNYRGGKVVSYTSVRRQASAAKISQMEADYQVMREKEARQ